MSLRLVAPPEVVRVTSLRGAGIGAGPSGAVRAAVAAVSEGTPPDGLHARLERVFNRMSSAEISRRTGVHAESVRRYRRGAEPSSRFLAAVCEAFEVSGDWLLCGRGEISPPVHSRGGETYADAKG